MSTSEEKRLRKLNAVQKKRTSTIVWIVVAIVLIGGLVYLSRSNQSGSPESQQAVTEIQSDDWVKGPADARVTLIEYGDFQCPACANVHPIVESIVGQYSDDVRFVYRHYPLRSIHPLAQLSAQAAEAAGVQGKFWEMYTILFQRQQEWTTGSATELFAQYASELGLDVDQFRDDLTSDAVKERVNADEVEARSLSLRGTPSFIVNGQYIETPGSAAQFEALIAQAIETAPEPEVVLDMEAEPVAAAVTMLFGETAVSLPGGARIDVIPGTMLGDALKERGVELSEACVTLPDQEKQCVTNTKTLVLIVNGQKQDVVGRYRIAAGDRILLYYGPATQFDWEAQAAPILDIDLE